MPQSFTVEGGEQMRRESALTVRNSRAVHSTMPELRKDPIVGRWVIIAAGRAGRPNDFEATPQRPKDRFCPFCEGHEESTPGEILAYRRPGTHADHEGWRVRVVPNKFPALEIEGDLNKRGEGIYDMMQGVGAHEVIIESPAAPGEHFRTSEGASAAKCSGSIAIGCWI